MNKIREFIFDLFLSAILGLAVGITLKTNEINKENERLNEELKQIEWVKCAKVQPQNNVENWGMNDGSK